MKKLFAAATVSLSACNIIGCATPPTAAQVSAIQQACALDALARPTVSALLALPGLATPEEIAAVVAARAVIDPVCANPGAPVAANVEQAAIQGAGQIQALVVALEARKASK